MMIISGWSEMLSPEPPFLQPGFPRPRHASRWPKPPSTLRPSLPAPVNSSQVAAALLVRHNVSGERWRGPLSRGHVLDRRSLLHCIDLGLRRAPRLTNSAGDPHLRFGCEEELRGTARWGRACQTTHGHVRHSAVSDMHVPRGAVASCPAAAGARAFRPGTCVLIDHFSLVETAFL